MSERPSICVVGAGVIGLASAYVVKKAITSARVTLISELFMPDPGMTSYGPAGFWEPTVPGDTPVHLKKQWGSATLQHYKRLDQAGLAKQLGITIAPGYELFRKKVAPPHWASMVESFHMVTPDELKRFPGFVDGWFYKTYVMNTRVYMARMMSEFLEMGGKCIKARVEVIGELYADYDVIINCTGMGARDLVQDATLRPVRGQVIKVKAPWVREFIFEGDAPEGDDESHMYIIPGRDDVTLGGTFQIENYNRKPTKEITEKILERCYAWIPSLREAHIIEEWAGLRPQRQAIRLEAVKIKHGDRDVLFIHNYGHQGQGVTLHWGCAQHVLDMVKENLSVLCPAKL